MWCKAYCDKRLLLAFEYPESKLNDGEGLYEKGRTDNINI